MCTWCVASCLVSCRHMVKDSTMTRKSCQQPLPLGQTLKNQWVTVPLHIRPFPTICSVCIYSFHISPFFPLCLGNSKSALQSGQPQKPSSQFYRAKSMKIYISIFGGCMGVKCPNNHIGIWNIPWNTVLFSCSLSNWCICFNKVISRKKCEIMLSSA